MNLIPYFSKLLTPKQNLLNNSNYRVSKMYKNLVIYKNYNLKQ